MAGQKGRRLEARDVVAFGQEYGRVLSDGRIVGRAEPFAKVFPSSRAVKRAVGVTAWAILEDIALDASIDVEGRLVAQTNVRRIAANLGVAPNTVTKHLGVLREHGFVLHEEQRDVGSGRYETSRYVLDPSACLERFTVTPSRQGRGSADDGPQASFEDPGDGPSRARPQTQDHGPDALANDPDAVSQDFRHGPCRKVCDAEATVSQTTGHRELRQNYKKKVGSQEPTTSPPVDSSPTDRDGPSDLVARLIRMGVDVASAAQLADEHPHGRIVEVLDAAEAQQPRSPAGWVLAALRDGWDVHPAAQRTRAARARRERRAAERHRAQQQAAEQDQRADKWAEAISDALDDKKLAAAIQRVTRPLPAVGRRPVPMVRTQLIAWAAAVHAAAPSEPLAGALEVSLATAVDDSIPPTVELLTPAPRCRGHPLPLEPRIAACLQHLDRFDGQETP